MIRFAWLVVFAVPMASAADVPVTFEKDVRPVFRKHCQSCHNTERPRGELDLSTYAAAMSGGTSGKIVVAGKPTESLLYNVSAHIDEPKMPPGKPRIPQRDLDAIRTWIEGGLKEKSSETATAITPVRPANVGLSSPTPLPRPGTITALAASPTAPLVAVPGLRQVLLYDLAGKSWVGALAFPEGEVHSLRFSADGKVLVAGGGIGGESGKVVGFETGSGKRLFEVGDELDAVLSCDLSPDRSHVVLGGPTRVVKVYSVPDGKLRHTFRKPTDWVTATAFSPEGLLVAAGDRFGGVFVWEAQSGKEFAQFRGHTKAITSLSWRADSNALATASEDGTARVWDVHALAEANTWTAHATGVLDVRFRSDGTLVTGGRDGHVRLWDRTGKAIATFGPHADHVTRVAVTADGRGILSGDWSGELRSWSAEGKAVPILRPTAATSLVAVVLPDEPKPLPQPKPVVATSTPDPDLVRKRAALKVVEEAAAKLKDEVVRDPKSAALLKAYLQLCESEVLLKAELAAAESAAKKINHQ